MFLTCGVWVFNTEIFCVNEWNDVIRKLSFFARILGGFNSRAAEGESYGALAVIDSCSSCAEKLSSN